MCCQELGSNQLISSFVSCSPSRKSLRVTTVSLADTMTKEQKTDKVNRSGMRWNPTPPSAYCFVVCFLCLYYTISTHPVKFLMGNKVKENKRRKLLLLKELRRFAGAAGPKSLPYKDLRHNLSFIPLQN